MEEKPLPSAHQKELAWIEATAIFLDNRFRIPGTKIRFGVDSLIGIIPYIGDVVSFAISGLLIIVMARKGASGMALLKMIGNVWIDGVVGTVPLLGDIFDLGYRANLRNLNLLKEHYAEGKHSGSAWPVVIFILLAVFFLIALSIWAIWKLAYWIFTALG